MKIREVYENGTRDVIGSVESRLLRKKEELPRLGIRTLIKALSIDRLSIVSSFGVKAFVFRNKTRFLSLTLATGKAAVAQQECIHNPLRICLCP
jgi:hypothetical protein